MADRHKHRPKAVRMPGGLLAWYESEAERRGQSVNSLIVAALEKFRQDTEGSANHPRQRGDRRCPAGEEGTDATA